MRFFTASAIAVTLCVFAASHASAWNGTGHMTVADIAYDNLTPKTKASVDALLQRHKDYGLWMSNLPDGYKDRARFAFMKAATWPDDIRKTDDDRPIWHYVDLPVLAPGYKGDPIMMAPIKPNAETQIPVEKTLMTDTKAKDGERAIALCWVEHLVGDIHQPLHDASFFSEQFPKGDRGGNSERLMAGAAAGDPVEKIVRPRNLHSLWDGLLGRTLNPTEIQKLAEPLEKSDYAASTYPQIAQHTDVHSWVVEGSDLAAEFAYESGKLVTTPDGDRATVTLPDGYFEQAHKVGNRQIALAGLRLAAMLNAEEFPAVTAPVTPDLAPPAETPKTTPAANATTSDATKGSIIGNKNSHVYHLASDGQLPAEKNRAYFQTAAEAEAAGYRKAGSKATPKK